jgi:uncharacterized SAM-binding protein YcdF (DUF218 family)
VTVVNEALHLVSTAFGLVCGALFVYHIRREPRRLLCGILLVLALYCTVTGVLPLLWPDTPFENMLALGGGNVMLIDISYFFMVVFFLGGIALCVNGIRLICKEGFSIAHALPVFFGITGILQLVSYIAMLALVSSFGWSAWLTWFFWINSILGDIFLYVPLMLAAVLLQCWFYAAMPKPKSCDFILVLGAGLGRGLTVTPLLAGRLRRAIQLYNQGGQQARFVVSGGQGKDERVSEAFAMKQYLLENGIPAPQILMEDRSTNTAENIRFSKALITAQKKDYTAMIVTSNYHVLRAVILAKVNGFNAQGVGGKTAFYYLPAAFLREYAALIFSYKGLAAVYVVGTVALKILSFL